MTIVYKWTPFSSDTSVILNESGDWRGGSTQLRIFYFINNKGKMIFYLLVVRVNIIKQFFLPASNTWTHLGDACTMWTKKIIEN